MLGLLMSCVILGLLGSLGYLAAHWVEMKKRRFFQPPSRIFQSRIKGKKARGWTPLFRRRTEDLEDAEDDYSMRSSGRRIEVLRPFVSRSECSNLNELDRSVPVYCCSAASNVVETYATVRPRRRMETFTPRMTSRNAERMQDGACGSYVAVPMPEPQAEDFPEPPASLLMGTTEAEDDGCEYASPVQSSDEGESG